MNDKLRALGLILFLAVGALPSRGAAQVPPTAAEIAVYTGLHAAAWAGNSDQAARLLADGASVDPRDGYGRTPLHVATYARHREIIGQLDKAGADLGAFEHDRYDALTIAAVADDEDTVAVLLKLGARPDQTTSRYDGTALIAAAHLGHAGVVRQLLAAGAPSDHINNLDWTALIEAIVLGDGGARHVETVKALLDAGADPNIGDRSGTRPLEMARSRGYAEMVTLLEAAGAR